MSYYTVPNGTSIVTIGQQFNTITGGAFGNAILLVVFFIFFAGLKARNNNTGESFVVAMLITTGSSVFLFLMHWVADFSVVISAALLAISTVLVVRYGQ